MAPVSDEERETKRAKTSTSPHCFTLHLPLLRISASRHLVRFIARYWFMCMSVTLGLKETAMRWGGALRCTWSESFSVLHSVKQACSRAAVASYLVTTVGERWLRLWLRAANIPLRCWINLDEANRFARIGWITSEECHNSNTGMSY